MFDYLSESGPEKADRIPQNAFVEGEEEWPEFEW
jgi:hypothetical protein